MGERGFGDGNADGTRGVQLRDEEGGKRVRKKTI